MRVLKSSLTASLATVEGYTDSLETRLTAARAGYLDNLSGGAVGLASVLGALDDAGAAGAVTSTDTLMAYIKQLVGLRPAMMPFAGSSAVIAVTGTGADLDFPSVVVAGIPTGATILRAIAWLNVGSTFDTSASENQIKTGTSDYIHVKASAAAWTAGIQAIPVPALLFETKASDYGGGGLIGGNTDISSVVTGNGTYNFRSEETNNSEAIEATGGNLELHTVTIVVNVWFY